MKILAVIPIIFLLSCSTLQTNNIAPGYLETYRAIKIALLGFEDTGISRELVDDIPYASMTLKIGKGPMGLMILESIRDEEYTWVSADPIYMVFRNGRVIKTQGLGNDLKNIIYPKIDFKKIINQRTSEFKAYYSYTNPELNNLELTVMYEIKGMEDITILNNEFKLLLVHERITNEILGWDFMNYYWIDEEGFVMKSRQILNPLLPEFVFQVTKKPSK